MVNYFLQWIAPNLSDDGEGVCIVRKSDSCRDEGQVLFEDRVHCQYGNPDHLFMVMKKILIDYTGRSVENSTVLRFVDNRKRSRVAVTQKDLNIFFNETEHQRSLRV